MTKFATAPVNQGLGGQLILPPANHNRPGTDRLPGAPGRPAAHHHREAA